MGTPTLENPGNRWKNPDFQVFPENSHPCINLVTSVTNNKKNKDCRNMLT
jgi:hypothetical protein